MQITKYSQPTHLISKNNKIKVWHYRFRHASNIKIIRLSSFLISIGNFDKAYNLTKVYSNSKQSDNNSSDNNNKSFVFITKALLLTFLSNNNFNSLCILYISNKQI